MSAGIPHGEWALLIGGPDAGAVVRVPKGAETVVVAERQELPVTEWLDVEHVDVMADSPRLGTYRRQHASDNFKWEGWDA
jgi:hypothetical protein